MHRLGLRGGLVAVALLAAGLAPQAAAAQTLTGEKFASAEHTEAFVYDGACNPEGESTFTYYTYGSATGPVPGVVLESGTFTLASPSGPVTSYTASYTIDPDEGDDIEGTKSFTGTAAGSCSVDAYGYPSFEAQIPGTYSVTSPFAESGPASTSLQGISYFGTFASTFGASPSRPATKDDCKNGGYAQYGFKNQGECVAWVNQNT